MEVEILKFIDQPKRIVMKYRNTICIVELNRTQIIKVLCLFDFKKLLNFADRIDQMLIGDKMGEVQQTISYKADGMGFMIIKKEKKTGYDDILNLIWIAMLSNPIEPDDKIIEFYEKNCTLERGFLFYDSNE